MNTPWGRSNTQSTIAQGITRVTTTRHGGFRLDDTRWQELKTVFPDFTSFAGEKWLEEDCDWAIAYAVWPDAFTGHNCLPESNYPQAVMTLTRYLNVPEAYWNSGRGQRLLAMAHRNGRTGFSGIVAGECNETDLILSNRDF